MRSLGILGLVAVASLVSQTAAAQPVRACPPGQAVQSLEPGGKVDTCIAVPAPVNLDAVNAAIAAEAAARAAGDSNEAAARAAADTNLNGRVDAEAVARMQADQDIRDSLVEHGISGRYSVVGQATCYRAPSGFTSTTGVPAGPDFTPVIAAGVLLQPQTFTFTGIRTVSGGPTSGTMSGSTTVYNLVLPGDIIGSTNVNSGSGNINQLDQQWSFTLDPDGTLTIKGTSTTGTITQGGNLVGATVQTTGAPAVSGVMSRDGRMVVLTNAAMQVEHSLVTPVGGTTTDTPRVCVRMETMYKLPD